MWTQNHIDELVITLCTCKGMGMKRANTVLCYYDENSIEILDPWWVLGDLPPQWGLDYTLEPLVDSLQSPQSLSCCCLKECGEMGGDGGDSGQNMVDSRVQ